MTQHIVIDLQEAIQQIQTVRSINGRLDALSEEREELQSERKLLLESLSKVLFGEVKPLKNHVHIAIETGKVCQVYWNEHGGASIHEIDVLVPDGEPEQPSPGFCFLSPGEQQGPSDSTDSPEPMGDTQDESRSILQEIDAADDELPEPDEGIEDLYCRDR